MTAPGFVPRPDRTIVDRLAKIEARLRSMQQNTAGATTAAGGAPLSNLPAIPVGPTTLAGASLTASRSDHVHTSALTAQQDVIVTSPTAGNILAYNGAGWANAPNTLANDSDVTITTPVTGQQLTYNGTRWVNTTPAVPTLDGQVLLGSGIAGTLGTAVYTTSGTTELNLPKLALANVPVVSGRAYVFHLYLYGNPSVANTDFWFRVRTTTAVSGTNILRWNLYGSGAANLDEMAGYVAPWIATSTGNVSFYLSAAQLTGSGNLNVCAGSAFWIADGGAASQWSYT